MKLPSEVGNGDASEDLLLLKYELMVLVLLPLLGPRFSRFPTYDWELSHLSEAASFSTVRSLGLVSLFFTAKRKDKRKNMNIGDKLNVVHCTMKSHKSMWVFELETMKLKW